MYINVYNTADNCVFMLYFFDYIEKKIEQQKNHRVCEILI